MEQLKISCSLNQVSVFHSLVQASDIFGSKSLVNFKGTAFVLIPQKVKILVLIAFNSTEIVSRSLGCCFLAIMNDTLFLNLGTCLNEGYRRIH